MKKKILLSLLLFKIILLNNLFAEQITIVFPKDNYVFNKKQDIFFQFNNSFSLTTYQLQVDTDSLFKSLLIDQTLSSNNFQPNPLVFTSNVTYYWRVRAKNSALWSKVSNFSYYSPDMLPDMNMWFRSDSGCLLSGNKLNEWNDLSASNIKATQSNLGNMPTFINSIPVINNFPVVNFSSAQLNFLTFNKTKSYSKFTVICLRNFIDNNSDAQFMLAGDGNSGIVTDVKVLNYGFGNINGGEYLGANVNNQTSQYAIYSHTNYKIRRNKVTPLLVQNNPSSRSSLYTKGRRPDNYYYLNTNIAEIIAYNDTLSPENLDKIENYLRYKYAPPVNLGFDTVYGTSFCDSFRLDAGSQFSSFLWSTGETAQSINITTNGKYSVKVKDIFGIESSDDIVVLPYKKLSNNTVYICNGDTLNINLNLPIGFNAQWSNGINSDKNKLYQNGTYTVLITDLRGCTYRDTINIIVNKSNYSSVILNKQLTVCNGEKLYFLSNAPIDSISWSTGSNQDFIAIQNPGIYTIFAKTSVGCIFKDTFNVTIAGNAPVAAFDNTPLCQNNLTQFTDISTITTGATVNAWKWNFSNGSNSTQQNPTTIFGTTGAFSASLKVTTNQGCTDSIYKTFVINKRPAASFSNRKSCEGNPTLFEDLSIPNSTNIIARKWNFANLGIVNDVQTPAFVFPSANTYNVQLIVTNNNGCVDSITKPVKVNQSPISDFSFDAVCGKSPVNFRFLATVPTSPAPPQPTIATWQWDFGDNTFNSAIKDVSHVYATTGTYTVKLLVTSSDQCPNTIEKQIKVYEFPIVDFDISPTQCAGKEIQFTDRSQTPDGTPISSWKWYFSGQSTDTMKNTSYTFPTEGNYTIQLTAANAVGCTGTKLRSVAVSSLPVPKFTFSPQNGLPPLIVNYTNQSPITGNYVWNYGDGSPAVQGFNPPTHIYNTKGTYPITLTATNFLGCTDVLTKFILVDKAFIDGVMTSITIIPNGDFYQIQATILNASNIEIRDLGLTLQLGGGAVIKENWSGSIMPGQTTIYDFIGQIRISDNSIPVICTTIDNVNNNSPEDKTDNNSTCKEVRVGTFDVLNVYPNPAVETINFGVMLPKDGKVTIGFVDVLGQNMYKKEFDGSRGYNNLSLSTVQLNAAVYVAAITFDGVTIYEKFMRKDRK